MTTSDAKGASHLAPGGDAARGNFGMVLLPLEEAMVLQSLAGDAPWADLEQVVIDLNRDLPPARQVERALDGLIARHELLTTRVRLDAKARPHFVPAADFGAQCAELLPPTATGWTAQSLADWLADDRNRGFDLAKDAGWRLALFRIGAGRGRLVLTIHHAKADLTTMVDLARELLTSLFDGGQPGLPPPLTNSWAQTRRELWSRHNSDAARAFFAGHLGDEDVLVQPIATPASPSGPGRMARLSINLPATDTGRLTRNLARMPVPQNDTGFRLIHALQLAFGLALARHTGANAAQFGLTFSGRRGDEAPAAGSLIATLPQRLNLALVPDCAAALAAVAQSTRQLRQHHCADFTEIAQWAGLSNHNAALFDAALVYSPQSLDQLLQPVLDSVGGGTATLHEEGRMPVTLAVYGQDSLTLTLEYDPTRLAPDRAGPFLSHVLRLLQALSTADARDALGSLSMLDAPERAALQRLSLPDVAPPEQDQIPPCPITRIEDQCRERPSDCAILMPDGQKMNYARLDARVNGMAQELAALGVKQGQAVALNLPRGLDQVIAFLAVQKLGAAALPLDPDTPELDRNLRATECDVVAVIGREGLSGLSLPLLTPRGTLALHRPERAAPDAGRMAYILHTSGSTGRPKGVMGSTGALSAHATAMIRAYRLRTGDRVLQFASPGFDVALEEIIPTLVAGATLVLRPETAGHSIPAFLEFLHQAQITVVNLPAGYWQLLVAEMVERGQSLPKSLRLVVTGSERVDRRAWADWQRLAPEIELLNCYGPTEATISASHYRMHPSHSLAPQDEVPIGRPLDHARLMVMAFDGSPAPLGSEGELWIAGPCVTLGYLGRPVETAESFVALDGGGIGGAAGRAYRSGDRVRWNAEGQLLFLGRRDGQVKVRGHRIELEEVERQLLNFPGIREAHVALLGLGPTAGLVAWVSGPELAGDGAEVQILRRMAAERFGRAALPRIIAVPELPRKPNGKIDRAALPLPLADTATTDGMESDFGPTPDPSLITAIGLAMGEVLGQEAVAPGADIRDLGANSLTILRLASVLEARFGRPVRTLDLHHNTTPMKFARWLSRDHHEAAVGAIPVQKNGSNVPFIGVHMLGDREQLYRPLSEAMGTDYPVWGVTVGAPKVLSDVDIPRIAEQYRQDIEKSFPSGPIALGAVSLASYFAYELAQLLVASGRDVRLLAIFDAEGPSGRPSRKGLDKLRAHLGEFRRHGFGHLERILRLRADRRQIEAELNAAVAEGEVTGAGLVQANLRAVESYQPKPIRCPLVVYRAATSYWDAQAALDDALGWRDVAAAGVDLVDVPGDHLGILARGNVATMAGDLVVRLRRRPGGSAADADVLVPDRD